MKNLMDKKMENDIETTARGLRSRFGTCPHSLTAYNRGHITVRASHNYIIDNIQLFMNGGSTQSVGVNPQPPDA